MKFKKRKLIAAIAACALMAGTIPACINVYGSTPAAISAESEDTEMKRLLTLVKTRVTVPEELSEFSFSKEGKGAAIYYSFHWNTKNGVTPVQTLDISASGDSIISYNYYSSDRKYSSEPSFGALTEAQLTEKAKAYIKMLDPNFGDAFKLDNFRATLRGRSASFNIIRTEQGRDAFLNSGSISLNKDTGELESFEMTWWDKAAFSDISKAVSLDTMKSSFKAGTDAELVYTVNYNEDKKAYLPALVYVIGSDKYFDLLTGNESAYAADLKAQNDKNNVIYEHFGFKGVMNDDCVYEETAAVADAGGGVTFTPEELKAMEEENGLISKAKAEEIARADKFTPIASVPEGVTMTMRNARLTKNDERSLRSGYTWVLSFNGKYSDKKEISVFVNLDAKTGEILSVSSWNDNFKAVTDVNAAASAADAALKHFMGDKAAEYKLYETNEYGDNNKYITYTYARYVNGVRVNTDNITIGVDGNGVIEFSSNYHDVKFPSAEAVGTDKAYEGIFAANEFNTGFMGFRTMDGTAHTYPVFYLTGTYYVNAKTGVQSRYDGSAVDVKEAGYSDISGHWCEKYAEKLLEYNVYIDSADGKLLPDNAISREDLEVLLGKVFGGATPYFDSMETDPSAASKSPITYRDAVKMYIEYAGGDSFAEYKGIYKSPFKDVPDTDPDVGYFALAYGAGFASPNKVGGITPDSLVSRGMILYMLYNSLK